MSHFGVLSYKGIGHLNPLIALSRQLMARGHRITFFQKPELEAQVRQQGLEFCPISTSITCADEHRRDSSQRKSSSGIAALRYGIRRIVGDMEVFLRDAPAALTSAGVDTLIVDEIALSGPTLAEILCLPYFVVSTSVPHNFGWTSTCRFGEPGSWFSCVQNALLQVSVLRMRGPVRWRLDRYRRKFGLVSIREIEMAFPELAHITQLPQCLDFPRSALPRNFYYAGPFIDQHARPSVKFPWGRLDGRPVVYASLGTTRGSEPAIFHLISEACDALNVQLVISLGGRRDPEMFSGLPGKPVVVRDAPQLELLKKAQIVITHGGLNTALETLMEGKPMIVIPKSFDQPAVAARLTWLKVAEVLPLKGLSERQIRLALTKVLDDPNYRNAARELQSRIRSAGGLERAADLIEEALEKFAERQRNQVKNNAKEDALAAEPE